MISIYLFTQKMSIYFLQFKKKKLFTLTVSKEFINKFQFGNKKIYFYFLLL